MQCLRAFFVSPLGSQLDSAGNTAELIASVIGECAESLPEAARAGENIDYWNRRLASHVVIILQTESPGLRSNHSTLLSAIKDFFKDNPFWE